ncbi:lipoprotein [Listeria monocytogenes]|uniref:lipoprotein n=1 Tax=Listeria monocytogenes TaxID=1639 RepID=UPI001E50FC12|nr:lipoprotein [Listeria monocytogenes]MCD7662632.1 lipoprotein [Listeria monocytogenes]
MKKIISLILLLLILTACSNDPQKESSVEANGIVESVDGYSIVINSFKENSKKVTADKGEKIYFDIEDKYYNEEGKKIKLSEIKRNDKVLIELSDDYKIQETYPGKIDSMDVIKIIKLNS